MRRSTIARLQRLEQRTARKPKVRVKPRHNFDWAEFHKVNARLLGEEVPTDEELAAAAEDLAEPLPVGGFAWGEYRRSMAELSPALAEPAAE